MNVGIEAAAFPSLSSVSAREASIGSAIRLAAEVVVRLSSVVATLWLTRSLGVATFGVLLLALSIGLMIAELCDLGLNAVVVPLMVRSPGNLRTLFLIKGVMTAVVVASCSVLIPAASWLSALAPALLWLCTLHFLGASWIDMTGTALRALGRRVEEAVVLFTFRFTLVGLVIASPFGLTVFGVALAYATAIVPAAILGGLLLRARGGWVPKRDGAEVRSILSQAAPMGVNGYLAIFSTRVELFLLQTFQGAQLVGLFGGALRIVESLLTFPSAIAAGALPTVARDVVRGSRGAAQRTFGLVVWMGVPAAIGLNMCAPGVLLVLGPGFAEGTEALRILSGALFLCFLNAALFHILIAAGQTAIIPKLTAMRVMVAVVVGAILIPDFGLWGGSVSFTLAELLLFVALVLRTRPFAELEIFRPIGFALVASVPMGLLLSVSSFPLPLSIVSGALSFALAAAASLKRGTEANGLG